MALLFLDVDGVLNDHFWDEEVMCGQIQRYRVAVLNRVLRATNARIVLSSAWRYILYRGEATLMGLEWLFRSHGMLADRLIGITREDTKVRQPDDWKGDLRTWVKSDERGEQITDWLAHQGRLAQAYAQRYAVVDDLDLGISAAGHPFVQTDGKVGLTEADANRLIKLLTEA